MNERILALATQAGFENGHQDRNGNSLSYELEKFAELIVRECVRQINRVGVLEQDESTAGMYAHALQEHFGVK